MMYVGLQLFHLNWDSEFPDYNLSLSPEIQGMYILYLQECLHFHFSQEKIWTPSKGGPLQRDDNMRIMNA